MFLKLVLDKNVDSELNQKKTELNSKKLEAELWENLAVYMNTEVAYTLKRLLPGDFKAIYVGEEQNIEDLLAQFKPNPFSEEFECVPNYKKGGIFITENILYSW